jgi:hypothetical protein
MIKFRLLAIALCLALLSNSCKKEEKEENEEKYVVARFLSDYCPKTGAALVSIVEDSKPESQIALLNLPKSFQIKDKVLLITYHYDQALDKLDEGKLCPAIYSPLKIYVCDSATEPTL